MNGPDKKITGFIRKHHVLTLATSHGGIPWCSNVFYAYIAERNLFVFTSEHKTRHGSEALKNAETAASIVLETRTVGRVQGLQIRGRVRPMSDQDGSAPRNAYIKRFPYAAVAELDLWVMEPSYFKLTDNTVGFGKKLYWQNEEFER